MAAAPSSKRQWRRVILYDTGALNGPEVTRRHIAPFLWQRGFWRIDEVVISHADADHFNGLPALLEYFLVRQITTTPTFAERNTKPVRLTLCGHRKARHPDAAGQDGDLWEMDDVRFEVLHRRHGAKDRKCPQPGAAVGRGNVLLLTGDLQDAGLDLVMAGPAARIDVLMSPHHGSKTSNTPALADWARPQVVVSCQRRPVGTYRPSNVFERGHPVSGHLAARGGHDPRS